MGSWVGMTGGAAVEWFLHGAWLVLILTGHRQGDKHTLRVECLQAEA